MVNARLDGSKWVRTARSLMPSLGLTVNAVILAGAIGLAVLFSLHWDAWVGARTDQVTDDAYVRADLTPLSVKINGYVHKVPVNDFQRVKAGQLLVEVEDDDYRARVEQAAADVLAAEAAIENLKSRKAHQHSVIVDAQSTITATEADVERTRLEEIRQRNLLASTYGTHQRLEQATADEKRFQATLLRANADLKAQRVELAVLDTEELELRAQLKARQAVLELAKITLGYTRIVAPVDGWVSERGVREGQYVSPGVQVISVVPLETVWVVANYKETQLTRVAIGQPASVTVDTFPGMVVTGRVDSISPASGSQFSLLPPDNATGNFTKVVQRIPVKIVLDQGQSLSGKLRPGMSAIATIHTDRAPVR